jgi:monothiol glutaredoxin
LCQKARINSHFVSFSPTPLGWRRELGYIYRRYWPAAATAPGRAFGQTIWAGRTQRRDHAAMGIEQFIENEVKSNDVVLFMKGTPQFPQCGFSGQVVQILDHLGVPYKGLNVLESSDLRDGIKAYSNWPTIPQLYVKGEFVGGCDIVREMFQAGELQQTLKDAGVAVEAKA